MRKFDIGNRVIAISPVGRHRATGVRGVVVGFDNSEDSDYIAVEFDEDIGGTYIDDIEYEDENYECPEGHGWFVLPGDIAMAVTLCEFELSQEADLF